jgi:hypothetical protein
MLGWRARPVMLPHESFNDFFPSRRFQEKTCSQVPEWMVNQLDHDFKEVAPITANAVEKAFETIESRLKEKVHFDRFMHYRVLDNKLYKFYPENASLRDTQFERAFKSLLSHAKIPDVDFILCPMDGLPESYMPTDFYLMDDPKDQIPILAQAKLKEPLSHQVVLIPDLFSLSRSWYDVADEILSLNDRIPWKEKKGIAFWRGAYTDKGTPNGEWPIFQNSPRLQICRLSLKAPDSVNAGLTDVEPLATPEPYEKEGLMKPPVSKLEHLRYKYLAILDGHMCTYPGYQWRLLSDCACFKQQSDQIQWFYSALLPYRHYIPVANDMSDLVEKVAWAEAHPEEVQRMVHEARRFAAENLLIEDDYLYLYLVFNRYASMQKIDFKALKKQTQKDPRWVCIQYRKRQALLKMLRKIAPF